MEYEPHRVPGQVQRVRLLAERRVHRLNELEGRVDMLDRTEIDHIAGDPVIEKATVYFTDGSSCSQAQWLGHWFVDRGGKVGEQSFGLPTVTLAQLSECPARG